MLLPIAFALKSAIFSGRFAIQSRRIADPFADRRVFASSRLRVKNFVPTLTLSRAINKEQTPLNGDK